VSTEHIRSRMWADRVRDRRSFPGPHWQFTIEGGILKTISTERSNVSKDSDKYNSSAEPDSVVSPVLRANKTEDLNVTHTPSLWFQEIIVALFRFTWMEVYIEYDGTVSRSLICVCTLATTKLTPIFEKYSFLTVTLQTSYEYPGLRLITIQIKSILRR